MHTPSQFQQQTPNQSPKIYFSQKTFGKPTKNRTEDPSMFQLLTWTNQMSIESSDFKKKQKFIDPESAYMSMISKKPWISQSQQSYLNFHENSIEVNQEVFRQVQNYIHNHQSKKKQVKEPKTETKITKKNKNEWNQHQSNKKYQNGSQNQSLKVPEQSYKINNYTNDMNQKQNNHQRDVRKRPNSAKNISHLNSPKVQTTKQIASTFEDQQFQQSKFKKRDEITDEEQQKLIEKFKQTTRWIPNSSFMTYFGKPPFQNYGRGNTKPIDGGLVYGTYLYSHNVHPHRGANSPSHVQSYPVALMKAKSMGKLVPTQPKTACKYLQNKLNNQKERQYDGSGAIEAMKNTYPNLQIQVPDLHGVEKFGGTKMISSKTKFYPQQQTQPAQYQGKKYSNRRL